MKYSNHIRILFLLITVALGSCQKIVDLDIKDNNSKLVIEANITNEQGPYFVKINRSNKLNETSEYPVINNASVTISDDAGTTEILQAIGNGEYRTSLIRGTEGRTYSISVWVDDQLYEARSTMPIRVPFDSAKIEEVTAVGEKEWNLIPVYSDPAIKGNYYRFVLTVNGKLMNMHLVQNDEIRNGAVNSIRLELNEDIHKLAAGDQLSVTMQCIDRNVSLFYTALALMADSGPGGGTTPNNPPGNFSNGALGIFSAHTVETKTASIQ